MADKFHEWLRGRKSKSTEAGLGPAFFPLLSQMSGTSQFDRVKLLFMQVDQLSLMGFYFLLGRAVQNPEQIAVQMAHHLAEMGRDVNGNVVSQKQ